MTQVTLEAPDLDLKPFKILSLDGGGIRGAFSAAYLAGTERILKESGKLGETESIAKYFDLIAGTSTGGIIACALALGKTAEEILDFYLEYGPAIFTRRKTTVLQKVRHWLPDRFLRRFGVDRDGLKRSLYDSESLRLSIQKVLGDKKLSDAQSRLVVPAVRLSLGRQIVFRTAHLPNQIRDPNLSAVDVIMATTAAPTYFPPHRIENKVQPGQFIDGGVWANHPGLLAYVDAIRLSEARRKDTDPNFTSSEIKMLSIGTGETPTSFEMKPEKSGLFGWAPRLIDTMMTAQSQGTHFMLRHLLSEKRYFRIDFHHCGWKLDSLDRLRMLVDSGLSESRNLFARMSPDFFAVPAKPFVRFP